MTQKRYPAYKPSGIEWIGEIPSQWECIPIRWSCSVFSGGTPNKDKPEYWDSQDIPWLNSGEVNKGAIFNSDNFISITGFQNSSAKWIKKHTVLMALAGQGKTKGSVATLEIEATCNQSMAAIEPISGKIDYKYLFYFLKSKYTQIRGLVGEDRDGLNLELIKGIILPKPPLNEQLNITSYLDKKTALIDSTIRQKERLLELLQEERTAIINRAVTRGLDPNVPMKDSGVEWLGQIPEHWEVIKIKYIAELKYGLGQPPKYKEDGLPLIRATNVYRGDIDENDLVFVDPEDVPWERDPVLKKGDIIVVRSGAYTADSAIIPQKYDGAITGYDMVVRATGILDEFLALCLLSDYVLLAQLYQHRLRAAQPHLNREELGETVILLPPLSEQEGIVKKVKLERGAIDSTIITVRKQRLLLQEYRTTLINDVVTGKRCILN
jgi:type I restriction enzyme S subunit